MVLEAVKKEHKSERDLSQLSTLLVIRSKSINLETPRVCLH